MDGCGVGIQWVLSPSKANLLIFFLLSFFFFSSIYELDFTDGGWLRIQKRCGFSKRLLVLPELLPFFLFLLSSLWIEILEVLYVLAFHFEWAFKMLALGVYAIIGGVLGGWLVHGLRLGFSFLPFSLASPLFFSF